jgi:methanogenic corrinoid protein MtbC1
MSQKEQLRNQIEEERERLNAMLAGGAQVEETYRQSLVVDALIEEYMNYRF